MSLLDKYRKPDKWQNLLFSKHIQNLPLPEMAAKVKKAGFDGLDLTVRTGGSIEPKDFTTKLPEIIEVLAAQDLKVGMITSEVTSVVTPHARNIVKTAAAYGIRHIKLGYYYYTGFGSLKQQRQQVKSELKPLAELCSEFGVTAGFHNHSHDFFGASLWDIAEVIGELEPKTIGLYFDAAHATIEGGSSGWLMGMDLLADRIVMLAVKDFRWVNGKHRYAGNRHQSVEMCPLEHGNTQWSQVITNLQSRGFSGPVSFHGEYQGAHSFADLTDSEVIEQSGRDLQFFRQNMSNMQ